MNKDKISLLPKSKKVKLFISIPVFTAIASFLGNLIFLNTTTHILLIILGILAILYGIRLMFIHFQKHETELEQGHPVITRVCSSLGLWISGFFIWFDGDFAKTVKNSFCY